MSFRLTYATMFNPPEAMHERFEAALARVEATLGARHPLFIDGADREPRSHAERSAARSTATLRSASSRWPTPGRRRCRDGRGARGVSRPGARRRSPSARACCAGSATIMEQRVYEIAAALSLEVGKNRMEALGEAQETVDFFRHYADDFESHAGFAHALPDDPIEGVASHNRSVMRPYGAWVVIAPFNFPLALAGGPGRRGAGHRQHRRAQGRQRHAVGRPPARRLHPRCRLAAGRVQLPVRLRPRGRRGAGAAPAHRRHHLHRLGAGGTAPHAADGRRRVSAAVHRRDGRQESVHRHRARRPRPRRRRHRALRLRHGRAEVLGAVAAVRARERRRRADREAAGADRRDPHRRSAPTRALARAGRQSRLPTRNYARYVDELRAGGATPARGGAQIGEGRRRPGSHAATTSSPTLAEAPLAHPLWQQEMFLPILMLHRYQRSRRGDAPGQRHATWA